MEQKGPFSLPFLSLSPPSLSLTHTRPHTHTHPHTPTHTHTHTHFISPYLRVSESLSLILAFECLVWAGIELAMNHFVVDGRLAERKESVCESACVQVSASAWECGWACECVRVCACPSAWASTTSLQTLAFTSPGTGITCYALWQVCLQNNKLNQSNERLDWKEKADITVEAARVILP